jgi:beta-lactamase regulating signal transducer with metallopeptidase domain
MDLLLHVGLSNAVVATALALIAAVASVLWRRRPALVHGLWLLVLLKLLTPPLVRVPIPVALEAERQPAAVQSPAQASSGEPLALSDADADAEWIDDAHFVAANLDGESGEPQAAPTPEVPAVTGEASIPLPPAPALPEWRTMLPAVWAIGTAGWFVLAGARLLRFSRLLRYATPAPPEVQEEADRIAAALGMKWCPEVRLLPGRLAPMVWAGLAAPRMFLPADLLGQMDETSLSTLMAHELAHLRRGDHRVRLLEFLALGLFWWHPVVWLARRALREAEEQCCDAWVVAALPGAGKTYATALLKTLDFLSAAPAAPPLACGIGRVSDLKRRLTMIMRGATPRTLCWREGLAVLVLATLLPLLPTLARAEPEESDAPKKEEKRKEEKKVIRINADDEAALEKAKAELKRLEADLQKKAAEVREAGQRLKQAAEQMGRAEAAKARDAAQDMARQIRDRVQNEIRVRVESEEGRDARREMRIDIDGKELKRGKTVLEGPIEIEVTADGKTIVRRLKGSGHASGTISVPVAPPAPPTPPAPAAPEVRPAPRPGRVNTESTRRIEADINRAVEEATRFAIRGRDRGEGNMAQGRAAGKSDDRRIDELERKLDAVLRQLESMKKEKVDAQRKEKTDSKRKDKKSNKSEENEEDEDSL